MRDAKNWKIPYKGFIIVQNGTNAYYESLLSPKQP